MTAHHTNGNRSAMIAAIFCGITVATATAFGWWALAQAGRTEATTEKLERLSTGRELGPWQQGIEARLHALENK
jgi:hypothetical protein